MLEKIFNCSSSQSILHIENIKGSDGEIALKAGENEYFGVINVGDAAALFKKLQEQNFNTSESSFKDSLFAGINNDKSNINILIGAKKFTEGWNSYRVSCMGLLNVGQSEGSSIIQLFGRGVRLKGYNNSLKRSSAYKKIDLTLKTPEFFNTMETLNIFGINADYMKTFDEFIRREGVEIKEYEIYKMNVIRNKSFKAKKLYTIKLKDGLDYKKHADIPILHYEENINVILDLFNTVQSVSSQKIESKDCPYKEYHIPKIYCHFFNYDNIYFKMQEYKNMTGNYNINITKECIIDLLACNDSWSVIHAYNDITIISSFEVIARLENIAIMLLKKYFDKFYYKKRLEWESQYQEYVELSDDDNNSNSEDTTTEAYVKVATWTETQNIEDYEDPELEDKDQTYYNMTPQDIPYQNMTEGYTIPFEFLWALLVVGNDKEFVLALADLVYGSDIEITVDGYKFIPDLQFMNDHAVCRYCGQIYMWDYE